MGKAWNGGNRLTITAKNSGGNLAASDLGTIITVNSSSAQTVTFNWAPTANDLGRNIEFNKLGSGSLTITAYTGVTIEDSSAAGTIYTSDTGIATMILRYVSLTAMVVVSATGTWTTT